MILLTLYTYIPSTYLLDILNTIYYNNINHISRLVNWKCLKVRYTNIAYFVEIQRNQRYAHLEIIMNDKFVMLLDEVAEHLWCCDWRYHNMEDVLCLLFINVSAM